MSDYPPSAAGNDAFSVSDFVHDVAYDDPLPPPEAIQATQTDYYDNHLTTTPTYNQTPTFPTATTNDHSLQQWFTPDIANQGQLLYGQDGMPRQYGYYPSVYPSQALTYAPQQYQTSWDASQPLSASTSFESVASSHPGSTLVSPSDAFPPAPTSMDPMTMHQGVDGLASNQGLAPGYPWTGMSPYFPPNMQGQQYMYPQYMPEYPQVPPLQQSPLTDTGAPMFQTQSASVALSRTSSRSSSDRVGTKKTLTELQRRQICEMAGPQNHGQQLTQLTIAHRFGVDRSTISKVLKQQKEKDERLAKNIPDDPAIRAPRGGVPRFQAVEDALGGWLDQQIASGQRVADSALTERAKEIAAEQRCDTFKCSPKWVNMFKQRRIAAGKLNKPLLNESAQHTPQVSPSNTLSHLRPSNVASPGHASGHVQAQPGYGGPWHNPSILSSGQTPAPLVTAVNVHGQYPGHYATYPTPISQPFAAQPFAVGPSSAGASPSRHGPRASYDGTERSRTDGVARTRSYTLDTASVHSRPLSRSSTGRPRLSRHQSSASVDWRKKSMGASALGLIPAFGLTRIAESPAQSPHPKVSRPPMHARARSDVTSSGWGRAVHAGTTPDMSEGDARSINTPLDTPANGSNGLLMSSLPVPDTLSGAQPPKKRTRLSLATTDVPNDHTQYSPSQQGYPASQPAWPLGSQ